MTKEKLIALANAMMADFLRGESEVNRISPMDFDYRKEGRISTDRRINRRCRGGVRRFGLLRKGHNSDRV